MIRLLVCCACGNFYHEDTGCGICAVRAKEGLAEARREQQEKFEFLKMATIALANRGFGVSELKLACAAKDLMNEVWKHKGKL